MTTMTTPADPRSVADRAYDRASAAVRRMEADAQHSAAVNRRPSHYPAFCGALRAEVLRLNVQVELLKARLEGRD